jgi:hypothetical protein
VIGQAQGLLMAWLDMDADNAFAYLRRVSSHENRKLRDVAAEIVRTRQRPGAERHGPVGMILWGDDEGGVAPPADRTDHDG